MINMLDLKGGPFDELLSAAEAAEIWNIDQSSIRKAISDGRLTEGLDCRKFGKQWVVTADAMHRVFRGGWSPWSRYLGKLREQRKAEEDREYNE